MLPTSTFCCSQPLAHDLLQQLPAVLTKLSDLQLQLAQQGTAALQLQQQLMASYAPLLLDVVASHQQAGSASVSGWRFPLWLDTVPSFRQQQLCHHLFELQQQQQRQGWFVPSYSVYLHDKAEAITAACEQQQEQEQQKAMDIAAAEAADSLCQLLPKM